MQLEGYITSRLVLDLTAVTERDQVVLLQASAFKLVVVVLGDLISEDGLQTVGYGRNHYASTTRAQKRQFALGCWCHIETTHAGISPTIYTNSLVFYPEEWEMQP